MHIEFMIGVTEEGWTILGFAADIKLARDMVMRAHHLPSPPHVNLPDAINIHLGCSGTDPQGRWYSYEFVPIRIADTDDDVTLINKEGWEELISLDCRATPNEDLE
jgi:hypothetical protein